MAFILRLSADPEGDSKSWVALITGRHPLYGLARTFIGAMGAWKEAEEREYVLGEDGMYEICEMDERRFVFLKGDTITEINKHAVAEIIADFDRKARKLTEELDSKLAKFDAEGKFRYSDN